jgi:hypothetical protein
VAAVRRGRRILLAVLLVFGSGALLAWRHQSVLIGRATQWYLGRVAAREENTADLTQRRGVVAGLHRALLMSPPPDAYVPELFDVVTLVSSRVASGEISWDWVAHLYTTYVRDLGAERPDGTPRRTPDEIRAVVDRYVAFYAIRKRPDARGVTVADVFGTGDDVITLEEIEEAERLGKEIDARTGELR